MLGTKLGFSVRVVSTLTTELIISVIIKLDPEE